jgi:hypothetical protein
VVKLQRSQRTVISAEDAASTSFGDECRLDPPAAFRHTIGTATLAPVVAAALEDEVSQAVATTQMLRDGKSRVPTRRAPRLGTRTAVG